MKGWKSCPTRKQFNKEKKDNEWIEKAGRKPTKTELEILSLLHNIKSSRFLKWQKDLFRKELKEKLKEVVPK